MVTMNLELNIKHSRACECVLVFIWGWGFTGELHGNSILCICMRSFQCEMHFIFWMKMAQIKYLQNETYK